MKLKRIISELKRRNVLKATLAYLVVAWIVVQVASIILPAFNAPDKAMRNLVIIVLIGFPIWAVFSWMFDITTKGVLKTKKHIDTSSSEFDPRVGQRLNKVIIIALAMAVVLLVFNQLRNQPYVEKGRLISMNGLSGPLAVLPFVNNKPDPESDYFGYALADQIIGDLSYLQHITVRPSSSIRKYDKKIIVHQEVKDDLNVDFILTGNYIREDNRVRLNVELVDLESNELIWRSDNIEVDYQNIIELQDIVSKKVVNGLNIQFSDKELHRIAKDIPNDPLAHEYYLRGISYPLTTEGDALAIEMLKNSITLDSVFAPAYGELGFRLQRFRHFEMEKLKNFNQIESYYLKALSINPELLSALGYLAILYTETSETEKAVEITKKMIDINPNNASARFSLGYLYRYTGLIQESISEMEKALKIDPKNPNFGRIGISYLNLYEYDKAFEAFEIGKETSYALTWKGITLFRKGNHKEAQLYFNRVIERNIEPYLIQSCILLKAYIEGNIGAALAAAKVLEEASIKDSEGLYYIAVFYSILGNKTGALRSLKEAVDRGYFNYHLISTDPLLDDLRGDSEFEKLLGRAKEKHEYYKTIFLDH